MPQKRLLVTRYSAPGLCKGQKAFLEGNFSGPDNIHQSGWSLMEYNRFCWLTSHCRDPEAPLVDGSPGPVELWRRYGKDALQQWRATHPDGQVHPAEQWLGQPDDC